jgi:hypothetical protein
MRSQAVAALGVGLFVAAVYVAAGPGRIDIIDAQYRFEVAKNIVEDNSIQLRDPFLSDALNGFLGAYSPYGISGSLTGVPLVALATWVGEPSQDRQQFLFSFTSAILGGATASVLLLFLIQLHVAPSRALVWTLIASFATLAFPVATSTFDQTQHGFFILCAVMFAFMAARRDSFGLAAGAGVCLGFLVNFQPTYAVLFVPVAIAALAPPTALDAQRKRGFERGIVVVFAAAMGVLVWMSINNFRFGTLLAGVQMNARHPPALGNPLVGLPALLASPGKSIFLYSPPTAIAVFGLVKLMKRERRLGQAVAATCAVYLALISTLTFYGGDWCWGPRYFASILPLIALGYGFVEIRTAAARFAVRAAVIAGLSVQALALSVDHHRFFYSRSLPTFFWYFHPGYYFTHSALFSRPGEIIEVAKSGVPPEAEEFRPGPYSRLLTYAVFGGWGHPNLPAPLWMRHYQVFWLPRPWPLWMRRIPEAQRPVDMRTALIIVAVAAGAGLAGMSRIPQLQTERRS